MPAGEPLALEDAAVAATAGQVQAPGRAPAAAVTAIARDRLDPTDGVEAEPVAPHGVVGADPLDQVRQVGVDLVLDQRGGGRGAAAPDLSTLEQGHADTLQREPVRHQGARNSAPDDGHVAAEVAVESRKRGGQADQRRPQRCATREVHGPTYPRATRWCGDVARRSPWRACRSRRLWPSTEDMT
jgi:hypothetical protein